MCSGHLSTVQKHRGFWKLSIPDPLFGHVHTPQSGHFEFLAYFFFNHMHTICCLVTFLNISHLFINKHIKCTILPLTLFRFTILQRVYCKLIFFFMRHPISLSMTKKMVGYWGALDVNPTATYWLDIFKGFYVTATCSNSRQDSVARCNEYIRLSSCLQVCLQTLV